ncbi:NADH-quinone oxidoreductase subunit NuoE [bacterium]
MEKQLTKIFSSYEGKANELITILQNVQEEMGYLPEDAIAKISDFAQVPVSKVYGVATFYTMFRFKPVGKNHVCICRGTACHVRGADQLQEHVARHMDIEEGDTTEDGEFSLETVACLGCCALAPVMTVSNKEQGHKVHGRLTPAKATRVLKSLEKSEEENGGEE